MEGEGRKEEDMKVERERGGTTNLGRGLKKQIHVECNYRGYVCMCVCVCVCVCVCACMCVHAC